MPHKTTIGKIPAARKLYQYLLLFSPSVIIKEIMIHIMEATSNNLYQPESFEKKKNISIVFPLRLLFVPQSPYKEDCPLQHCRPSCFGKTSYFLSGRPNNGISGLFSWINAYRRRFFLLNLSTRGLDGNFS
jgi:hypothetical protein